jgi:hypothetical protein
MVFFFFFGGGLKFLWMSQTVWLGKDGLAWDAEEQ